MSTKHTPGPWSVDEPWQVWAESAGEYVAITQVEEFETLPRDQIEANARLIAAAPDLLEAAKQVLAWYEAEDDHSKADFYERIEMCRKSEAAIRAAIAKAEGA